MHDSTRPLRPAPNRPIQFIQIEIGRSEQKDGEVIVEMPVSLTVNGQVWLTFMCTPVDLEAMAVGFLFNEGVVRSMAEVESVHVCASGDNIDVWLDHAVEKPDRWRRTSGCTGGVTSVEVEADAAADAALDGIDGDAPADPEENSLPPAGYAPLTAQQVGHLIEALFEAQDLYRRSGGVHTSALSDGQDILLACEDIGRHNTLDKLAGRCLMGGIALPVPVLLTTGRISSEMMQKAARLGAGVVISRTSPSSLSIRMAERRGITLIGYARRHRFNIYTHPQRILGQIPAP